MLFFDHTFKMAATGGPGGKINHPKSVFGGKNSYKKERRVKKIDRKSKKKKGVKKYIDALATTHILKKTRTNPKANIALSGKKRRLLLKQLKREETEKQKMDVVIEQKTKPEMVSKEVSKNVKKMDVS